MCFWGERRLGVRLRRAGCHGKVRRKNIDAIFPSYHPTRPARLNLTPNLLTPQKHINSDWVPFWYVYAVRDCSCQNGVLSLFLNAEPQLNPSVLEMSIQVFAILRLYPRASHSRSISQSVMRKSSIAIS